MCVARRWSRSTLITSALPASTSCPAAVGSRIRRGVTASYAPGYHRDRMADDVRARVWETGGRWYAHILDAPAFIEVTGTSRPGCLAELRKITGDDVTLTLEVVPQ